MDTFLQDLRQTLRSLARSPAFTAVVVLTLALGIGANAAIYNVVSTVLLRPLPFGEPERLVRVYETFASPGGRGQGSVSYPNFVDWREQTRSFGDLAAYASGTANLQGTEQPERVSVLSSTANLFSLLGAEPRLGRTFAPGEDRADAQPVAVLSERFWKEKLGGDPAAVGRQLTLDGQSYTVVGVMPGGFRFPAASAGTDLWVPLRRDPGQGDDRGSHWLAVVGRLEPGVSLSVAQLEMSQIAARLAIEYPDAQSDRGADVRALQEVVVGRARPALLVLMGAAGLVLLIACANAANLLLARSTTRRREVAIRTALGAPRGRLVGQFLLEALVLSLAGAVLGLGIAQLILAVLVRQADGILPRASEVALDLRVFAYLLASTAITATAVGLIPALQAMRSDPQHELREGGTRTSGGRAGRGLRNGMVAAQVALSFVLLVGAGLLLKSFARLMSTETGLRTENVLTMQVAPSTTRYPDGSVGPRFYRPVLERVQALPGVRAAGWISLLPLQEWGSNGNFAIEGRPDSGRPSDAPFAEWRAVSPGYFAAVGVPVRRGRDLLPDDTAVVLINQALADRYFPGEDPVGRNLVVGKPYPIVGVVADVRQAELTQKPHPELYYPYLGDGPQSMSLVVSTTLPQATALASVRAAIRAVDPGIPVANVRTLEQVIAESVSDRRLYLFLLGTFAVVAVVLAAAGLYGVMSYSVAQRMREFGIRLALGSGTGALQGMVVKQGARLALAGLVIGIPAALAVSGVLRTLLYGVSATDPLIFVAVGILLVAVALVASFIPARRATRVDPIVTLRIE